MRGVFDSAGPVVRIALAPTTVLPSVLHDAVGALIVPFRKTNRSVFARQAGGASLLVPALWEPSRFPGGDCAELPAGTPARNDQTQRGRAALLVAWAGGEYAVEFTEAYEESEYSRRCSVEPRSGQQGRE